MKSVRIFLTTFLDIIRIHDLFTLAGQITYYALLSIFPLLLSALNVLSYLSMGENFFTQLSELIPEDFYQVVSTILTDMVEQRNIAVISIGTITSIWAASKGIEAILRPLQSIYQIPKQSAVKLKLLSLIFYVVFIAALIVSFLSGVLGNTLAALMNKHLSDMPLVTTLWQHVRGLFSFFLLTAVFLLLYKLVAGGTYTLRKLIPGALLSAGGWTALSLVFSIYVHYANNYSVVYGSLAGVMLLLLWLNWTALILMFGAAFTVALDGSFTPDELIPPHG